MDTRNTIRMALLSAAMIFGAAPAVLAQGPVRHGHRHGAVVVRPVGPRVVVTPPAPRVIVRPAAPVIVRPPMPARRAEMRPHVMRHGYVWVDGAWQWNGAQWVWQTGHFQAVGPRVVVRR
jgi:hypothetical protein